MFEEAWAGVRGLCSKQSSQGLLWKPLTPGEGKTEDRGGSVCPCASVWVSARLRALEPLRMCLCRWPLFKQHLALEGGPPTPATRSQPHTSSYPLMYAHRQHPHTNTPHAFTSM